MDDVERLNAGSSFRYRFLIVALMPAPVLGQLVAQPALERPDLLAPPVHAFLSTWDRAGEVGVAEIDPELADTAACLVRADTRADVNNVVKRALDVRKCSFHPMERAVEETGMEYGGITPLGLPAGWRLLVDDLVVDIAVAVIGSGVRRSKLLVPGALLADLPGAEVSAIRQA